MCRRRTSTGFPGYGTDVAKINWQDIGELTAVDQNGINKAIVIPAKEALRQTRFALGGNLTLRDNQYAAVVTFSVTHGVEYTFQNPLKTTPIGFEPILTKTSSGAMGLQCNASLNLARTDGLLGLTVNYALTAGEMLTVVKTSNQGPISPNTETTVTFDAGIDANSSPGTALTYSSPNGILLNGVGLYQVTAQWAFSATTAGGRIGQFKYNNSRFQAWSVAPNPDGSSGSNFAGVATLPVTTATAGQVLRMTATSSVTVSIVGSGTTAGVLEGGSTRCYMQATRIRNDETPQYNVTGILWGG